MDHGQHGSENLQPSVQLRALLDRVTDSLFIVDLVDRRILDVNRHTCESLGYTRDELLKIHVSDVDYEVENREDKGFRWSTLEPGIPVTFEGVHHCKDGATFPVELRCDIIELDGRKCVLGIARNITDRKKAEAALREKEQDLRSLIASMNEGLGVHELVFDDSGNPIDYRILDVNPAYERMIKTTREKVIGRLMSEVSGQREVPYLSLLASVAQTGRPTSFEASNSSGTQHFLVSAFNPQPNQVATVSSDITERKQAELERQRLVEELEVKNAELERFTYTVSHDLKSPLITIEGYLGLLEEDLSGENRQAIHDDFQAIRRATRTMSRLLDELLELSRVGRIVNKSEPVSLGEIVQLAAENLTGRLHKGPLEIVIAPNLPIVYGDRARILEVFQNLIDNAAKYMGEQPAPRIEVGVEDRDGERRLFVRDNGIGINPKHHARIFDLFEQLDPRAEGTGVGLSLVKRIVEIHGGRIWVENVF